MASYNNISVSSVATSGTQSLTIEAGNHTGRVSRGAVFNANGTLNGSTINSSNSLRITQDGIGPYVSMPDGNVGATGGRVTLNGSSNLDVLKVTGTLATYLSGATIRIGNGNPINLDIQDLKSAAGYDLKQSGLNDPGAVSLYNLSLIFDVTQAAPSGSISGTVGDGSTNASFVIAKSTPASTGTLTFTSNLPGDLENSNIVITLTSAGEYKTGETGREVSLVASDSAINWTITGSNPS